MSIFTHTQRCDGFQPEPDSVVKHSIFHAKGCPNCKSDGWPDTANKEVLPTCLPECRQQYMVEQYRGRVVRTYERNGHEDSDFYAVVVDDEGNPKHVEYATTRGWTYFNGATVDVTPERLAKHEAFQERGRIAAREEAERERAARAAAEALRPHVGDRVRVKSKRSKVPHGTEGTVIWIGTTMYGPRLGFKTDDGTPYFCGEKCVEKITNEA